MPPDGSQPQKGAESMPLFVEGYCTKYLSTKGRHWPPGSSTSFLERRHCVLSGSDRLWGPAALYAVNHSVTLAAGTTEEAPGLKVQDPGRMWNEACSLIHFYYLLDIGSSSRDAKATPAALPQNFSWETELPHPPIGRKDLHCRRKVRIFHVSLDISFLTLSNIQCYNFGNLISSDGALMELFYYDGK